jgi:hypothetical protein
LPTLVPVPVTPAPSPVACTYKPCCLMSNPRCMMAEPADANWCLETREELLKRCPTILPPASPVPSPITVTPLPRPTPGVKLPPGNRFGRPGRPTPLPTAFHTPVPLPEPPPGPVPVWDQVIKFFQGWFRF